MNNPKTDEARMRFFIELKLKDKSLCSEDIEMWTEFKNVLESKSTLLEEARKEIDRLKDENKRLDQIRWL